MTCTLREDWCTFLSLVLMMEPDIVFCEV